MQESVKLSYLVKAFTEVMENTDQLILTPTPPLIKSHKQTNADTAEL